MLSIVIPTWQAERTLPQALSALADAPAGTEIVVADGGSTDRTCVLAEAAGCRVTAAARGRGAQLKAGAAAARGDWLLFIHADTRPAADWTRALEAFVAVPANRERAAVFRFRLDDRAPAARRLERLVAWRVRALALPYGDQGLLIHRSLYQRLGGYRDLSLFEDVDLVRRIGRKRLVQLPSDAVTSAERYRRDGYLARSARNLALLALYFLGLPPRLIGRLYQ